MFFSFCDSFCCCLYHLRHYFHDTQDSSRTRNKDVEPRLRPISYGVYPSFADTLKDYSRTVHEEIEPGATVPSAFHEYSSGSFRGPAAGSEAEHLYFNSPHDQPNRAAPMEFRAPTLLSVSHDSRLSGSKNHSVVSYVPDSMLMEPMETNLARNSRAYLGRVDDLPSATDFQAAKFLGQEQ